MCERFHSALSREQLSAHLREHARPRSRLDMWTARGMFFYHENGNRSVRLIRTGDGIGRVYADISYCERMEGGTELSVKTGVEKSTFAPCIVFCVLLILMEVFSIALRGHLDIRVLFYLPVLALLIWLTRLTIHTTPKLVAFIEEHLLC